MNMIKKVLLVAGVFGLGSAIASAPASAQNAGQAYISGSSAIVLMNGASQSVGAELAAPIGTYFTGATTNTGDVTVTPVLTDATGLLSTNTQGMASLNVNAGLVASVAGLTGYAPSSFTQAAAAALNFASDQANGGNALNLEETVSIIRAGAGVDGLD